MVQARGKRAWILDRKAGGGGTPAGAGGVPAGQQLPGGGAGAGANPMGGLLQMAQQMAQDPGMQQMMQGMASSLFGGAAPGGWRRGPAATVHLPG
jgi:hypothetical protein